MKKIISTTIMASALFSGLTMADNINSVKERVEGIVSQYMEGLCQGDTSKMDGVSYLGKAGVLNNKSKNAAKECSESGGFGHARAYINPEQYSKSYVVVGRMLVDLELTYKNNISQEVSTYVDGGILNGTNELTIFGGINF